MEQREKQNTVRAASIFFGEEMTNQLHASTHYTVSFITCLAAHPAGFWMWLFARKKNYIDRQSAFQEYIYTHFFFCRDENETE
jgi:hypothetical protein